MIEASNQKQFQQAMRLLNNDNAFYFIVAFWRSPDNITNISYDRYSSMDNQLTRHTLILTHNSNSKTDVVQT